METPRDSNEPVCSYVPGSSQMFLAAPGSKDGAGDAAELEKNECGSSFSAVSGSLVLPFEPLGLVCTRVEIADAAGRVVAECRPRLKEEGRVGDPAEEKGRLPADTLDGVPYWCWLREGPCDVEGALVVRYFEGENLLEIVEVPKWEFPADRPVDPRLHTVAREERHIHRSPEGRVVALEWHTFNAYGWLLSSMRQSVPSGGFETTVAADGTSVTKGWPGELPFTAVPDVTRVCLARGDGRMLAECRPITEKEAIAEYELCRGDEWPDTLAISRDGQWQRCHWSEELTVGETLSIQMFAGETLVRMHQEVVECPDDMITRRTYAYSRESLEAETPEEGCETAE